MTRADSTSVSWKRFSSAHIPEQRKLDIIIGDLVRTDLPYFDVCISNTPYHISSPFRLISHIFRVAILVFRREFSMRLVVPVVHVGKNNFRRAPQVESSVVRLMPLHPPLPIKFEEFAGFYMKAQVESAHWVTRKLEQRAAKMTLDNLLKLLSAFRDESTHFT
ncbi:hypothetical protein BDR05DRAFT_975402 [Suillus weaverae]|nr:hypothetical protein BDR05DRAFT_975402 [Suillus weaverae]